MPVPFVGRFSQAGMRARVSVGVSAMSIDAFDTTIGTKQVTIRASGPGVTHVGWTVYPNVPPYNWYDAGHDNIALVGGAVTVTVQTFAVGDRVKAYKTAATGGAASRDLTLTADSDYATAPPGTDPNPPGSTGPVAILSRMGLGINQARPTAALHTDARTPAYYQRYRDNGIRQVRFFPPVGNVVPEATIAIDPDSIDAVQIHLDAAMACVDSGMPVTVFDCTDVLGYDNLDSALYDYVQAVAERVAEMSFPVDRFIIGAAALWEGGNNAAYQPHRFTCNQRIRTALPNHTIVEGPCHWKNPRALFAPNDTGLDGTFGTYVPWADLNTMQDVQHFNDWDLNGMVGLAEQCAAWSAANDGRKVFCGAWGFDSFQHDQEVQRQIDRFTAHSGQLAIAKLRPFLWAVKDDDSFRMNDVGDNLFRPGFDSAVPGWAAAIDGLVAGTNSPGP